MDEPGQVAEEAAPVGGEGEPVKVARPLLLRPELPILAFGALWACWANPVAVANMGAHADQRLQGLAMWALAMVLGAWPLGAVAGALAMRAERAWTGRPAAARQWILLGMGWTTLAHWLFHLAWAPVLLVGAGVGARLNRPLLGALVALGAWVFAGGAAAVVLWARARLEAVSPGGVRAQRSRVATSGLLGLGWGWGVALPAGLVAAVALEGGAAEVAVALWMASGAVVSASLGGIGAAVASRLPTREIGGRAWGLEVAGSVWAAHWSALFLWLLLAPVDRPERLALAVACGLLLAVGVAARGSARAWRAEVPMPQVPVATG